MKNQIGFICLGQCGGNIGALFEQHGYNCFFINSSKEDLDTLNVKYRFWFPHAQGCSHDREKAIELLNKYYLNILEEVNDKLKNQTLIYLIFSTGGGTGSGLAPALLELCNQTFPSKHFGCIAVLPSTLESTKAQYNSFNCYKELSNIDKLASVFTLDNDKMDKFKLNHIFVNRFNQILDIASYTNIKGNIDNAELYKLLTTRGSIFVSACNCNNQDQLSSTIIKSWENSDIFADIEKDKQIAYLGLSLTHDINTDDLQKVIGTPFDMFVNYNTTQTITILSGLTFPKTRINRIIDNINSNKDVVKNNLNNSKTNRITFNLDFSEDINKIQKNSTDIDLKNLDDILAKYSV